LSSRLSFGFVSCLVFNFDIKVSHLKIASNGLKTTSQ